MARETGKGGGRGSRRSDAKDNKRDSKKSGWVKPDGTPLRKRKGDYFPDAEIEKKKPGRSSSRSDSYNDRPSKPSFSRSDDKRDRDEKPARRVNDRSDSKRPYEKKRSYTGGFEKESTVKPDRETFRGDDRAPSKKTYDKDRPASSRPTSSRSFDNESTEKSDRGTKQNDDRSSSKRTYDKDRPASDRPTPSKSFKSTRDGGKTSDRSYGKKPFEKKRVRYADKDHSSEMRGRFDKGKPKKFAGPHRERKNLAPTDPLHPYQGETIRLNRYIANAGICSRREADELITAGVISINGEIVSELGTKVFPGDVVKFHDQTLKSEKLVYVLLNKPKDYITTTDDPQERKTVMNLIKDAGRERIVPVGRLDRNTTGLLLISNDGELTKRLTHPSSNIKKIYQVELDRNLTQADMLKAADGVELDDGVAGFDEIHYSTSDDKNVVGVELHSGKNRIVRRIFESLGYQVKKLDRTVFAGLTKKDLPRGRWRFLTEMEVNMLKMLTGKKK